MPAVRKVAEVNKRSPFGYSARLEPELIPVDRICKRWAVSIVDMGIGADDPKYSHPPPFDPETTTVIDQIICRCPRHTNRFINTWYRSADTVQVIGRDMALAYNEGRTDVLRKGLQMSERGVYICWRLTLNFLRWKIEESGHKPLIDMLEVRIC